MQSTSLDQAITAYHSTSTHLPSHMNNTSPRQSTNSNSNTSNNHLRPPIRSGKTVTNELTSVTQSNNVKVKVNEGTVNDEALGIRESPDCRELACEGERLIRNGEFEDSIPLLEQGLIMSLLLETPDFNLVSVLWSLLGNAHYSLEHHNLAAQCHIHDFALCRSRSDLLGMAQALCNLGNAYFRIGKFTRACHCYLVYLHTVQSMGDQRSIAKAYHNLGDLFQTIGFLLTRSSRILVHSGELTPYPSSRLAKTYLKTAVHYFELNLDYMHYLKDKFGVARAYTNLANTFMLLQDYDKAIDFYEKRLTLSKEHQDQASKGRTICSIGNCLQAMKQLDKSIEFYSSAMNVAEEMSDQMGQAIVYGNLGTTFLLKGDSSNALSCYKHELDLMCKIENFKGHIKALDSLWLAYEQEESYENAMHTLDELITMLSEIEGYQTELQCVMAEKDRLQHFFRIEKDITKGKNHSLLKRFKTTSIKHIFKKDPTASPKLERGLGSPKNPHTRNSYQGKETKKRNPEDSRPRRHNSLTDPKDFAEIQEALTRNKSKSASAPSHTHPLQCHSEGNIQELNISPSTELMGLLYMTDVFPNSDKILSNFDETIDDKDDIYASYGSKTNHYTHFCLVSAVLAKLDTNGDVVDNENELCKKGMAFLSQWNGWIICQHQHIIDSSFFSVYTDAQPKESDMI